LLYSIVGTQSLAAGALKKSIWIAAIFIAALPFQAHAGVLSSLFSAKYLPHRYCYLAQPGLVWTNVVMDGLIAASYGLIFVCLFWIAARLRGLGAMRAYLWIFIAFGSFIVACAGTHLMEMVTVWWPFYPLSAVVKVVCAAASVPTAILFARATPALAANIRRFLDMLSTTQQEKEQAVRALVASEKLAVVGRISASITHEIKNPLDTLSNLLYLLANDQRMPEDVVGMLETAASEVERANSIAHNTLSLYRESTAPAPLVLSSLVESVLALQLPEMRKRDILVQRKLVGSQLLKAYPGEMRQILINLLQNAAAAVGSDGRILVRVQPRAWQGSLRNGERAGEAGYSITVADTGPGTEVGDRPRLFSLFFTTKGEQGTGLGLWLVRSMVEKQGGRIRFRSRTVEESRHPGTLFNVWIPLEPASLQGEREDGDFLLFPKGNAVDAPA
jgi:signal transduction histidine kinase